MEGKHYLSRYYPNPFPIGLCVLDTTEMGMKWSSDMFTNLLIGIMDVTSGTHSSQYVFLAFLTSTDMLYLQLALEKVPGWHRLCIGGINFAMDAPCIGAIDIFTALIFLSSGDSFIGYSELIAKSSEGPILDAALMIHEDGVVETMEAGQFLHLKTSMVIKKVH